MTFYEAYVGVPLVGTALAWAAIGGLLIRRRIL